MRFSLSHPVLALAVLVGGPLLGCGGEVCAGLLGPDQWARSTLSVESLDVAPDVACVGEAGPQPADPDEEAVPEKLHHQAPAPAHYLGGPPAGGAQSVPSGGPCSGGPVPGAIAPPPPVPQLTRSGLLFLNDALSWPPPFASRLFRPPRAV